MGCFSPRAAATILATLLISGSIVTSAEGHAPVLRAESEPNDTPSTATFLPMVGGYGIATGIISSGDVDVWKFTVAATVGTNRVWILTDTGGTQAAGATSRDSIIELLAPDGVTVLETDDNNGTGNGGDSTIETTSSSAIAGRPVNQVPTSFGSGPRPRERSSIRIVCSSWCRPVSLR